MTAALCSSLDASRVCWQGRSGPLTSDSLCARDFVQTLCSSGSPGVAYGIRGSLDAVSLIYGRWSEGRSGETEEKREAFGNTRQQGSQGRGMPSKNPGTKKAPGALGDIRGYMHCGSKGEIRTLDAAGMNRML